MGKYYSDQPESHHSSLDNRSHWMSQGEKQGQAVIRPGQDKNIFSLFQCQSNFFFFSGVLSLWCASCIVVHRETISFKKTIQGSFSHLILKIFAKKVLYLWWKQLVFSISALDYAFLHQIFKTGLIGFQKLMGYFGEAYVNIFNEIEISCNIIFSLQPKKNLLWMYF